MPRLKASRSADPRAAATRPAHDDEVVEIADEEEEEEEEQEPTPSPSPSPIAIIAPPAEPAVVAVPAPVLPPADASPGVSSGGSSAASDFSDDGAPLSDSEPSQSAVFIGPSTERDQLAARLGFDSMKRGERGGRRCDGWCTSLSARRNIVVDSLDGFSARYNDY